MIYLDSGATSFPKPPGAVRAMETALRTCAHPGRGGSPAAGAAARAGGGGGWAAGWAVGGGVSERGGGGDGVGGVVP